MDIVNVAAYKFFEIEAPEEWQLSMKERALELDIKGTIILASEGINLTLAGTRSTIDEFKSFLKSSALFGSALADLDYKESVSVQQPYGKMVVRIAREIITMKVPGVKPGERRAPAVDASTLKEWLKRGFDDQGREVVMLDTRNTYETELGSFDGALKFEIDAFSEFPEALQEATQADAKLKDKTVVSFCTGGIRCEKAAIFMEDMNFEHVYQLDGGILRYFEEVGGEHWLGECFVFDERIAVDAQLQQSKKDYPKHIGPRPKNM